MKIKDLDSQFLDAQFYGLSPRWSTDWKELEFWFSEEILCSLDLKEYNVSEKFLDAFGEDLSPEAFNNSYKFENAKFLEVFGELEVRVLN